MPETIRAGEGPAPQSCPGLNAHSLGGGDPRFPPLQRVLSQNWPLLPPRCRAALRSGSGTGPVHSGGRPGQALRGGRPLASLADPTAQRRPSAALHCPPRALGLRRHRCRDPLGDPAPGTPAAAPCPRQGSALCNLHKARVGDTRRPTLLRSPSARPRPGGAAEAGGATLAREH